MQNLEKIGKQTWQIICRSIESVERYVAQAIAELGLRLKVTSISRKPGSLVVVTLVPA